MSKRCPSQLILVVVGVSMQVPFLSAAWGYEAIEVKDGGRISGVVKFIGEAPAPEKIEVTKDTEVCGKTEKINEALLVGSNKGIKNVVVSMTNIQKGKKMGEGGILDQKECVYTPRVVLSPAGADLTILNSDGILHNIHTHSAENPPFNKAQPKFRKEMKEKFAQAETVKVTCDAHGWMSGWIVVTDHPYHAVTDANGAFAIADVPPGDYELKFWHETLGETTQKVSVKANEEASVSVEMAKK